MVAFSGCERACTKSLTLIFFGSTLVYVDALSLAAASVRGNGYYFCGSDASRNRASNFAVISSTAPTTCPENMRWSASWL